MATGVLLGRMELDLNISAPQECSESVKEVLRRSMLLHETAFKHQVRELHQLYWTQKNLMKEFFNDKRLEQKKEGIFGFLLQNGQQNLAAHSSSQFADFNVESSIDTNVKNGRLEHMGECSGGKVPVTFLRSITDQCYDSANYGEYGGDRSALPYQKYRSGTQYVIDLGERAQLKDEGEADASFSCSGTPFEYHSFWQSLDQHDNHISSSSKGANAGCAPLVCQSGGVDVPRKKHTSFPFGCASQKILYGEVAHIIRLAETRDSSCSPFGSPFDQPIQKKQSSSRRPLQIDLNAALDNEFLHPSQEHVLMFPSPCTSSSVRYPQVCNEPHIAGDSFSLLTRKSQNTGSKELSVDSASKGSRGESSGTLHSSIGKMESKEVSQNCDRHVLDIEDVNEATKQYSYSKQGIDVSSHGKDVEGVNSLSKSPARFCEHERTLVPKDFQESNLDSEGRRQWLVLMSRQNSSITSSSNHSESNSLHASFNNSSSPPLPSTTVKQGIEEDSLSSHTANWDVVHKDQSNVKFPNCKKSDRIIVNMDCEKSYNEHVNTSNMEDSETTQEDVTGPESCGSKRAFAFEKSNTECMQQAYCNVDEWPTEIKVDETIVLAAEMLVTLSLGTSCANGLPCHGGVVLGTMEEEDESNHYEDSFELLTLSLSESAAEKVFISSLSDEKMTEGSSGIKLRRGRGLRNFQKEILPGLVPLSRNEICEDLHNIGYVLNKKRSRGGKAGSFLLRGGNQGDALPAGGASCSFESSFAGVYTTRTTFYAN